MGDGVTHAPERELAGDDLLGGVEQFHGRRVVLVHDDDQSLRAGHGRGRLSAHDRRVRRGQFGDSSAPFLFSHVSRLGRVDGQRAGRLARGPLS